MKKYSLETKLTVVHAYLDGAEPLRDTAKKYKVSKTMLQRWVAKFQKHGEAALRIIYKLLN